jgi:hypothetical protein
MGGIEDLEEAICKAEQAVEATPKDRPDLGKYTEQLWALCSGTGLNGREEWKTWKKPFEW